MGGTPSGVLHHVSLFGPFVGPWGRSELQYSGYGELSGEGLSLGFGEGRNDVDLSPVETVSEQEGFFSFTENGREVGEGHKGRIEGSEESYNRIAPLLIGDAPTDLVVPRVSKRLAQAGKTSVLYRAMSRKANQREGGEGSGGDFFVKKIIRKSRRCSVSLGEAEAKDFALFLDQRV